MYLLYILLSFAGKIGFLRRALGQYCEREH